MRLHGDILIATTPTATPNDIALLTERLASRGIPARQLTRSPRAVFCAAQCGGRREEIEQALRGLPSIDAVHVHTLPYILSSKALKPAPTIVDLGDGVRIGGPDLVLAAGPCSIESLDQARAIARALRENGISIMRGGAFKPRTSPFSFQGLEAPAFAIMDAVKRETGVKWVTEAVDEASLEQVEQHADMIQIGARNMQNFALLKRAGRSLRPVLLKRGFSATLEDLLMAADYVLAGGNENVVLCERGIRTFCTHTRNTLDLSIVPALRERTHLPVLVDPSHGTGTRSMIQAMSLASVAAGAQGLLVEVHPCPDEALSDGDQSLSLDEFEAMLPSVAAVAAAVGRQVPSALPAIV